MSIAPTEQVVRDLVLEKARQLARDNPGMSVDVTLTAGVYHTPTRVPDFAVWAVKIGHAEIVSAPTFAEAVEQINLRNSPATKKAKAESLRKQADALEAEIA